MQKSERGRNDLASDSASGFTGQAKNRVVEIELTPLKRGVTAWVIDLEERGKREGVKLLILGDILRCGGWTSTREEFPRRKVRRIAIEDATRKKKASSRPRPR